MLKILTYKTKSTTLSKIIVPKDLSTELFSTPYKAVERANSPLLGMVDSLNIRKKSSKES